MAMPVFPEPWPQVGDGVGMVFEMAVDIERVERRFAETVFELGLMDPEGNLADGIDRELAATANGGDGHRAALARYAIELMDILDNADWSGYGGESGASRSS